ncbi:hypothetical protein H7170_04310 [Candidatus Gracilibacteria bacterium]|nr:hypothetical protein [Candidatus Gracilibacteria bacterium]
MCFSAFASFTSGAILITAGVLTLSHVQSRASLPFAMIPLLFGIQQCIEGVVWMTFDSEILHMISTYIFMIFAYVFWPIYVPITIWLIEKHYLRKKLLAGVAIIGIAIGAYLFTHILTGSVESRILVKSIYYDLAVPLPVLSFSLYFIATCGSTVLSSVAKIRIFGAAMLLTFFVAHFFYTETFFSVWCFFAAILSLIIYMHMRDIRQFVIVGE